MPTSTAQPRAHARPPLLLLLTAALAAFLALAVAGTAHAGTPYYHLISDVSGKALMPAGESRGLGVGIVQRDPAHLGAQHWFVDRISDSPTSGATVRRFRNRHSKLCITAPGAVVGAQLVQMGCDGYSNWRASSKADLFGERPVTLRHTFHRMCVDLWDWSPSVDAPIHQFPCHGGQNQTFRIQYRGTTG